VVRRVDPVIKETRKRLARVVQAVGLVWNDLGLERAHVSHALSLLEEAEQWLRPVIGFGLRKIKLANVRWPEALLFWAISELRLLQGLLRTKTRSRITSAELFRVKDLLAAASAHLQEAWLAYLYAHGLPPGYKPVRSFYKSGGILYIIATAMSSGFLTAIFRLGELSDYLLPLFVGLWDITVTFLVKNFSYPPRRTKRPLIVGRSVGAKRIAALTVILTGMPLLGLLLRPDWIKIFGLFAFLSLATSLPYLVQALRLLFCPREARILVLPRVYVVFAPGVVRSAPEKVFIDSLV